MPPKRKKGNSYSKWFIGLTITIAIAGIGYLVFLWAANQRTSFVQYKEFGIPIPTQYGIHGIDVSRYQQRISWASVKKMNVRGIQLDFAFIKATEGTGRVDPLYKRNWRKAKEAGVIRGAYHFFIPWKDGRLQAEHFIKTVTLSSGDMPPVLDIEQLGGSGNTQLQKELKEWLLDCRRTLWREADYLYLTPIFINAIWVVILMTILYGWPIIYKSTSHASAGNGVFGSTVSRGV
jgi:lysozyme